MVKHYDDKLLRKKLCIKVIRMCITLLLSKKTMVINFAQKVIPKFCTQSYT
jgi:hypothetical protein